MRQPDSAYTKRWRNKNRERYSAYMKQYSRNHYLIRKARFDELKSGGCAMCGYNVHPSALDFHHREPSSKSWSTNQFMNRNWDEAQKEVRECVLLCANCHRIIHAELPHESGQSRLKIG